MDFLTNFNQMVIQPGTYSPISSKGGRRRNRSRKLRRSRRHKKTNKSRTRRYY
jgi:hypothetical protein